MLRERKCRIAVDPMRGSYNPLPKKLIRKSLGTPEIHAAVFIAGPYRCCSQLALVLRKPIAHSAGAPERHNPIESPDDEHPR